MAARTNRFAQPTGAPDYSSSLVSGISQWLDPQYSKSAILRDLAPYEPFGLSQNLKSYNKPDPVLRKKAIKAVLKEHNLPYNAKPKPKPKPKPKSSGSPAMPKMATRPIRPRKAPMPKATPRKLGAGRGKPVMPKVAY